MSSTAQARVLESRSSPQTINRIFWSASPNLNNPSVPSDDGRITSTLRAQLLEND